MFSNNYLNYADDITGKTFLLTAPGPREEKKVKIGYVVGYSIGHCATYSRSNL